MSGHRNFRNLSRRVLAFPSRAARVGVYRAAEECAIARVSIADALDAGHITVDEAMEQIHLRVRLANLRRLRALDELTWGGRTK